MVDNNTQHLKTTRSFEYSRKTKNNYTNPNVLVLFVKACIIIHTQTLKLIATKP